MRRVGAGIGRAPAERAGAPVARARAPDRPREFIASAQGIQRAGNGVGADRREIREVMRYRLGLCAAFEQRLGGAAVERVAAALEQAVVGRIANQRVLETIGRRGRRADEAFERGLQGGLTQPADFAEQRKGKIAAQVGPPALWRRSCG